MKTYTTYSVISLTVVACLTSFGILAAQPNMPVSVENTVDNPVPVRGAVTVDNDATNPVPVTVENQQTSITVDNASTNPVPVVMPDPVSVKDNNYRYVGKSSTTLPNIGASSMDLLCQETYGTEARMCDTKEYFKSPPTPGVPSGFAWVWPDIVTSYYNSSVGDVQHVVYPDTTINGPVRFNNCLSFSTSSSTSGMIGITVEEYNSTDGVVRKVGTAHCTSQLGAACCAPH